MSLMSRRALLRSAGAAVGAAGVASIGEVTALPAAAATAPAVVESRRVVLHGTHLRTLGHPGSRPGEQVTVTGRLHRTADGPAVGQLYATATVVSDDVVDDGSPARLEHHLLHLEDATLTATGTVTAAGHGSFVVTGGSGRHANARGTYTTVQSADSSGGGDALFTIDLH